MISVRYQKTYQIIIEKSKSFYILKHNVCFDLDNTQYDSYSCESIHNKPSKSLTPVQYSV